MKITRLKVGYSVRLNDSEFAALEALVRFGQADLEGANPEEHGVAGRAATLLTSGRFAQLDAMAVDEDRR